ncbi:5'/3'-nucleotidase SurE [Dactylosporangium sp. NPDC049525]|uniref:5'/3'-nucleotidase SurE n=1 Tax=Dactylosporangium sp. NPDC049525 TaxID=3154730 RepID=UPI0034225A1F
MTVLITNDDGVAAPGIRSLAAAVRAAGHRVLVAAPLREASGMSAALNAVTEDGKIVVEHVTLRGLDDVRAHGVAASPAYITVLAALGAFGPVPDVVLSGINRGANAGHAVLHSGTVGAALTGANYGMRGMAVSLDVLTAERAGTGPGAAFAGMASGGAARASTASGSAGTASGGAAFDAADDEARHWDTAAAIACRLLPWLIQAPAGTVLNVNSPDRDLDAVAGLRRAGLAPFGQVQMTVAETGDGYVRTVVEEHGGDDVPGSDIALLAAGYATVTPIGPPTDLTSCVLPADLVAAE